MKPLGKQAAPALRNATRRSLRIIGGQWKRSPLPVVDAPGLRPTPDRVRETVFNWLGHAWGGDLAGRSALDLFAGSGALGFEAASRGAAPVVLVEQGASALAALAEVRTRLRAEQVEIRAGDAFRHGSQLIDQGRRFDVVFVDPPFASPVLPSAVAMAATLCAIDGFVYVESPAALTAAMLAASPLVAYRSDKAGEVFYHLLQRKKTEEETSCW